MGLVVLVAMLVFALAVYGWGRLVRALSGATQTHWTLTIAIGLAAVLALGGVLNAVHLATANGLLVVIAGGLAAGAYFLRRTGWTGVRTGMTDHRAVYGVAAVLMLFTVATQLPPSAYNYADDYGKYFLHPLLMLQRGTVFGSPLSDLGSETLGGKAFLDGFVVALFPIRFINATDAVFGLALCLLTAGCIAPKNRPWAGILCMLAVIFIEPQYINISALYLGSALMMSAVLLTVDADKDGAPVALGLIYAGLVSLKTTFALFVPLHIVLAAAGYLIAGRRPLAVLRWAAITIGVALLALVPWLITHLPHYLDGLNAPTALIHPVAGASVPHPLFATDVLPLGGAPLQYSLAVLAALAAAATLLAVGGKRSAPVLMAALCAAGCYGAMVFAFGPLLAGYATGYRYFAPFAIGIVPTVFGLVVAHSAEARRRLGLVMAALPVVIFAPTFFPRTNQALNDGFILGFGPVAESSDYQAFNDHVLGGGAAQDVAKWQAMVPEGEPLAVWITAPFYLDLERNPVFDIDTAGLATPWAEFPTKGYIIYEFGSYASPIIPDDPALPQIEGEHERLVAAQKRQIHARLTALAKSDAVYQDGTVMILKLPENEPAIRR